MLALLGITNIAFAANRTPMDNQREMHRRIYPDFMTEQTVSLTNAGVGNIAIGRDIKTGSLSCTGDAVVFNVSYLDPITTNQSIGDLVTSNTDDRVLTASDGVGFFIGQETEFNYIYLKIGDESGSATCNFYRGAGQVARG